MPLDMPLLVGATVSGFIAHLAKSVISLRKKTPNYSIIEYFKNYEYHFVLNFFLTLGMFIAIYQSGYMNGITAFFTGFASNSVVSIFRNGLTNANQIASGQTPVCSDTGDELN